MSGDGPGESPGKQTSLGEEIDRLAAESPEAAAIVCEGETETREQLSRRSSRLARRYAELGVGHGSMVTIGLRNSVEFYEATVACWKLGAVPQPVSHRLPEHELRAVIEVADPALLVGLEGGEGRPSVPAGYEPPASLPDTPLLPAISPSWKAPTSGGSTGRPKIIESTTPGIAELVEASAPRLLLERGDVFLCTGPLYHNAPFGFSLTALLCGGTVVLMERFDAARSLELVEEHRVTWMYLVPTMMQRILRLPDAERLGRDVSSVRVFYHLGAPCPPHVKRAWIEWVGPERVWELYGGTEAQAVTLVDGREWLDHPGSVGRVARGEMVVLDGAGNPAPPGVTGKIWMRSPDGVVTYRYRGAEPDLRDGGWESLGDMGWFDDDGYLYIADRESDMILVGGANVYPAEVEAALAEHPAVLSSCVIGLPDDEYGNTVHALVEVSESVSDEELRAHLVPRLVSYKIPRSFERSREPLRDEAGKVRRRALRAERLGSTVPASPQGGPS